MHYTVVSCLLPSGSLPELCSQILKTKGQSDWHCYNSQISFFQQASLLSPELCWASVPESQLQSKSKCLDMKARNIGNTISAKCIFDSPVSIRQRGGGVATQQQNNAKSKYYLPALMNHQGGSSWSAAGALPPHPEWPQSYWTATQTSLFSGKLLNFSGKKLSCSSKSCSCPPPPHLLSLYYVGGGRERRGGTETTQCYLKQQGMNDSPWRVCMLVQQRGKARLQHDDQPVNFFFKKSSKPKGGKKPVSTKYESVTDLIHTEQCGHL